MGKAVKKNGVTLVEMMIAVALLGVLASMGGWLLRSTSQGFTLFQKRSPLQRDAQTALQAVQGDLLSASKSSIGNFLPDLGFEQVPPALSTAPATGQWSWSPRPLSMGTSAGVSHRMFIARYDSSQVWRGRASMLVSVGNWTMDENVDSPGYNLTPGVYSLTARVRDLWIQASFGANVVLQRWDAGAFVDDIVLIPNAPNWAPVRSTFTVNNPGLYRVQLRHAGAVTALWNDHSVWYDQIALVPLGNDLTPGSGPLFFLRYDAALARYRQVRYSLAPAGNSGALVREVLTNGVWVRLGGNLPNIRRLNITWDGGNNGGPETAFPLILTLESGPVGATGDNFLRLSTRFTPPLP